MSLRPDFVEIEHPDVEATGWCTETSLHRWVAQGWGLVQPQPEPEPEPSFVEINGKLVAQGDQPEWTAPRTSNKGDDTSAADKKELT